MPSALDRRQFLAAGAAAGVTLYLGVAGAASTGGPRLFEPNAWLAINTDGGVVVHIAKAEMGQGIGTALAQVVAEELEADWKDVRIDYPVNDPKFGVMHTGGSLSVSSSFETLSRAGAAARLLLVDAAARLWAVEVADCFAARGTVSHRQTGRTIAYGDLVSRVPITRRFTADELKTIALKKPADYKLIGTVVPRFDIPDKVDGRATFGLDVFLPGMAYARVAYPPTRAGKHTTVDDTAARHVKGYLKTVVTDSLVAVVAETFEAATAARDALRITWAPGPGSGASTESILREYERLARAEPGTVRRTVGDAEAAMARAAKTHAATYITDFVAPAPLEPMNCVAHLDNGVYELFTGTQTQAVSLRHLSNALGVERSKIRIHQQYLGGGLGARLEPEILVEAALVAREAGRPIKLIRSREEDMARAFPRSITVQTVRAGLDGAGRIVAWNRLLVVADAARRHGWVDRLGRTAEWSRAHRYEIANYVVRGITVEPPVPVGFYRSVGMAYAFFAIESFMDELAHLASADPVQMRLGLLAGQPRFANVVQLAASRSGWGTPLPPNVGRGFACTSAQEREHPTWTAAVVQARVDPATGMVAVEKITCVVDCGIVVSPDGVRAQVEGGLLFGLSQALKERMTLAAGAFDQKNFEDYQLLRMNEVPREVDVHVLPSTEPPTGIGEPPVTVVPPALGNAIFAATGARVRRLPFLPERVLEALREKT